MVKPKHPKHNLGKFIMTNKIRCKGEVLPTEVFLLFEGLTPNLLLISAFPIIKEYSS
jgi:hypothetical protein